MKPTYSYLLILLCIGNFAFAQQISVDNSVPLQSLIEDYLVEGCVEISNISSSVNGSANGFSSFASFNRSASNFPLENGIVISTGNANLGGNTLNTVDLSEGTSSWGTDTDLETALGISNTLNATSIEFDFTSVSNQVQFNYILASEEYSNIYPCQYSDGFAFLIKQTGSALPYQNIALVPGTSTPVSSNTIHDEIFGVCPAQNEQYFDGYNQGDTNYNGRTTVLTATANTTPYVQYHIKLIIADQSDYTLDSAVFIEANTFTNLDLGDDISTCAGALTLDGDIQNPQATYEWFLNNTVIPSETNPTLNVTQSGTYKLEISIPLNGSICVIDDEVVITINSEQTANPISNYELCDDLSNNGIEIFDLTIKDTEVLASVPPANYSFTYHYSDSDARNNVNSIINPLSNSSSPQSIFVRLVDLDSACLAYVTFDLIVNPVPNITTPTTLEVCEDDIADGYTDFDLTLKDNEITSGQSNLSVSYHFNQADADNGANAIGSQFINTNTPNDQVFVRVIDTQTGCVNTTTLNLTIIDSPIINRDPVYIDACDQDYDGFASFDLTQVIAGILQGLTGVTTTFHLTQADAESGTNPIANTSNYQNIDPNEQVIYLRVEDNNNGCPAIFPIELHTNMLLTATEIQDFALCDDSGNDGIEDFDLNTIANIIANGIPNVAVSFYETQADRDNNTNAIDTSSAYTAASPQILYINLGDGNCSEVSEITLFVNPVLLFNPVNPINYCDTDDDAVTSIDLNSFDSIVTGGNPDFGVRYFATQTDADSGVNQHPPFYTNVVNPETFFARIENVDTGCFSVNSFDVNVIPAPTVIQPSDIIICDNDQDGFSIINLDSKISEVISNTAGLNIGFFTSNNDANNNTNAINNTSAYSANTQTIYIRVETASTGCFALVTYEVIVNTLPDFPNIEPFQICEDDNNLTADFLLLDKDLEILNGQTGKDVSYYENQADATNGVNNIDKNTIYQNTSSPQTIYVRVENISDTSCFGTSVFTIQVAPNPIYNAPNSILICDDLSNDGVDQFDFNDKVTEISQGSPDNLNISFHVSLQDAEDAINAQPLLFTNTENPQQIYVRIENSDSSCSIIEEFGINIIPSPNVTAAQPFEQCDVDYDGVVNFDLTIADFQISDIRQDNLVVNYFETLTDLDANINAIPNETNYSNLTNPQTVYIRVTNALTLCYQSIPLDLVVNLPPALNTVGTVEICDNDTNTYDLSQTNPLLVNDPSLVNISYYSTQIDADNNINAIGSSFNYTASNHTIYSRVADMVTGCPITSSFNLQINPNPTTNTPQDLEDCDDDYDGFLVFDLSQQTNAILGIQNPANFTVTYFDSLDSAENNTNNLEILHASFEGETIYARIENKTTGCFNITQFNTYINPLPVIPVNDVIAICRNNVPLIVNADTNIAGDTFLWSTGETTAEVAFGLEDVGDYWVTITTALGCEAVKAFSLIESEEATIDFTTTVDFADPNSITVSVSGIGDYVYMLDYGLEQVSNVFNNVSLGLHTVIIRDLNGCNDVEKEVVVIDVPKFVTPNNDGYFDTWHIVGIEQLPGTLVYIYDRQGKLLKTLTHTAVGWDGTFNGEYMPSNDYWFLAEVIQNGNAFDVKGHFTLKR